MEPDIVSNGDNMEKVHVSPIQPTEEIQQPDQEVALPREDCSEAVALPREDHSEQAAEPAELWWKVSHYLKLKSRLSYQRMLCLFHLE